LNLGNLIEKRFNTENTEFSESAEKKKISNEEIEKEKEKPEKEKNSRAVDAAAWESRDGSHERNRNGLEAVGFFTEGVERAGRCVTRKVAPEKRKLIVEPHEEITAAAPHQRGASQEQEVPDNGQGPEPRACSPIHKSSQAPTRFV
jgi:predicted metal-dependent hydrolase